MPLADITIVPVPSERQAAYVEFSKRMAAVYRDHGATSVVDYWQSGGSTDQAEFHADGTTYGADELRSIASLCGADASEAVVVSVTIWPSREVRDSGTIAATSDPRVLATMEEDPVFDGARLAGATFEIAMSDPPVESPRETA